MFETFKRWFSIRRAPAGASEVAEWAKSAGHSAKRTREGDGMVVDVGEGPSSWRLEWGPPQRRYLVGHELRLRGEINGGADLQMLLLSRSLMETLEKQVFEQVTESLQTRIDTDTPEEMRWLVLFPKAPPFEQRELRDGFGAVAGIPQALAVWLEGALTQALVDARRTWLQPEDALALVVQRGRLTMRLAMPVPDRQRVAQAVALYEVALASARRVGELANNSAFSHSTHGSSWGGSQLDTNV